MCRKSGHHHTMGNLQHLVIFARNAHVVVTVCVIHEPQSCMFNLGFRNETELEEAFLSGRWTSFCDGTPDSGQRGREPIAQHQPTTTATKRVKGPGTTPRCGVKNKNSNLSYSVVKKENSQSQRYMYAKVLNIETLIDQEMMQVKIWSDKCKVVKAFTQ